MTFGEKIKKLRKEKNLTQNDLSKTINVHSRLLGKYELDQVKPTTDVIVKIARALKVSTDYLLFNEETESKPSIYIKDIELLELFEKLEKMKGKDKETIISVINAFITKNKK